MRKRQFLTIAKGVTDLKVLLHIQIIAQENNDDIFLYR